MKKLTVLMSMLGVILAGSAFAQTVSFTALPSGTKDPHTGNILGRGIWDVTVKYLGGEQWSLDVKANTNPAVKDQFGVAIPGADAEGIDLHMLDASNNEQTVAAFPIFGGVGPGGGVVTSPWTPTGASDGAHYHNTSSGPALSMSATNEFFGVFSLTAGESAAVLGSPGSRGGVSITINDSKSTWTGAAVFPDNLTPEPDALALILPGIMPIGLALRRRRATRS